ncbi:MAG: peptide chain release factor N(5)-glutamine methyltransferase [Micavibrio sp.]|nr:peptide chain release factor N(5)-glutamine methyltransferase [Micavibrio sp.]
MSIPANDLYEQIIRILGSADIETAAFEARILIEDIGGVSMTDLRLDKSMTVSREITENIVGCARRRAAGEPLGRILGYRDFWKDRFHLSKDTLEPRPDTETLIESVLKSFGGHPPETILDLGTGSGCILLSLLREFPKAKGIGIDLSIGACQTASLNMKHLGFSNRCTILSGSWCEPLEKWAKFDLIVSNPPYIPSKNIPNLQKEVRNHDPIFALDGGEDGLTPYKNLLPNLKKHLAVGGRIFFEIGVHQSEDVMRLAKDSCATLIRITKDLGGIPRVVEISYGDK